MQKGQAVEQLGFFHKIRTRFILAFAAVVVVLTASVVNLLARDYYRIIDQSAESSVERLSESIFQTLFISMNFGGSEQVHRTLQEVQNKQIVDSLDLYVSQEVIELFRPEDSYDPPKEIREVLETGVERYEPIILANGRGRGIRYIKPFPAQNDCVFCHINSQVGAVLGVMDMTLSLAEFDALSKASIIKILTVIMLLVAASGCVLYIISTRLVFAPLGELQLATQKLAENAGDPNARLGDWGKTEFGKVAYYFNRFIEKVYNINQRLTLEEQKTKELLENREEEVARRTAEVHELNRELMRNMDIVDDNVITSRTDTKGVITLVSAAFCRISEYSKEELVGQPHNIVRHPDMPRDVFAGMWKTIKAGKVWEGEVRNRKKGGGSYWVNTVITPLFNSNGKSISGYMAIRHDISLQKELEETIVKLTEATKRSHTDSLTGMMNRLRINELLQMEIDRVERYGGDLCVALLDIDHFKLVNDTYGHLIGDEVLKTLAKILTQKIRKTDLSGRWGGEEFLLVLTSTPLAGAIKKMDAVRRHVETQDFEGVPRVTVSIGVSVFQQGDTLESLVGRADVALYFAKESGRNRVEASPTDSSKKVIEVDLDKGV